MRKEEFDRGVDAVDAINHIEHKLALLALMGTRTDPIPWSEEATMGFYWMFEDVRDELRAAVRALTRTLAKADRC